MPLAQFRAALRDGRLAIHAALTAVMAWLAVILALSSDTFSVSKPFTCMATIGSELAWAMAFWVSACLGLVGLLTPSRGMQLGSVLLLATIHGVVAGCLALSNPATTGTGAYAVLAALGC
jgi:hypothetical protein